MLNEVVTVVIEGDGRVSATVEAVACVVVAVITTGGWMRAVSHAHRGGNDDPKLTPWRRCDLSEI